MLRSILLVRAPLPPGVSFESTAATELYTLSLHDALPISPADEQAGGIPVERVPVAGADPRTRSTGIDRKSTRLNSSHANISYAVFCLKKKMMVRLVVLLPLHLLRLSLATPSRGTPWPLYG